MAGLEEPALSAEEEFVPFITGFSFDHWILRLSRPASACIRRAPDEESAGATVKRLPSTLRGLICEAQGNGTRPHPTRIFLRFRRTAGTKDSEADAETRVDVDLRVEIDLHGPFILPAVRVVAPRALVLH